LRDPVLAGNARDFAIFLVASSVLPVDPGWNRSAFAQAETSAREAFEAAKELGTPEAWNAFIASFSERLLRRPRARLSQESGGEQWRRGCSSGRKPRTGWVRVSPRRDAES
jgi:hypothetical protein